MDDRGAHGDARRAGLDDAPDVALGDPADGEPGQASGLRDVLDVRQPGQLGLGEVLGRAGEHRADASTLRTELRSLSQDEWPTRLRRLITEQTGLILRRTVDPDRPFVEHGLDSLGNLELRTRIEAETGIRITPKAIATHNTAHALSLHLTETLVAEEGQPLPSG